MLAPPFRWDLQHRNQLGSLVEGERAPSYPLFHDQLLVCCSRVIAFGGDADLVFVGRSPESIFDHLSGLLFDSSWLERLTLLHFSMRFEDETLIRERNPGALVSLREYLHHLKLDPHSIARRERPVAFVDLVYSGETFGNLTGILHDWSNESGEDWKAVRRRLRIVGITERTKNSPNTWRWQQHAAWVSLLEHRAVKNVSVPHDLWQYMGNHQEKVSRSYTPLDWGDPDLALPSHLGVRLRGLRLAYELFESGRSKERREEFAALLARERAMEHDWLRRLVVELRS